MILDNILKEEDQKTCWKCGKPNPGHSYPSERGENRVFFICDECEEELQR